MEEVFFFIFSGEESGQRRSGSPRFSSKRSGGRKEPADSTASENYRRSVLI